MAPLSDPDKPAFPPQVLFGVSPNQVIIKFAAHEPWICRDQATVWQLMVDLHNAYQQTWGKPKPKEGSDADRVVSERPATER